MKKRYNIQFGRFQFLHLKSIKAAKEMARNVLSTKRLYATHSYAISKPSPTGDGFIYLEAYMVYGTPTDLIMDQNGIHGVQIETVVLP